MIPQMLIPGFISVKGEDWQGGGRSLFERYFLAHVWNCTVGESVDFICPKYVLGCYKI